MTLGWTLAAALKQIFEQVLVLRRGFAAQGFHERPRGGIRRLRIAILCQKLAQRAGVHLVVARLRREKQIAKTA